MNLVNYSINETWYNVSELIYMWYDVYLNTVVKVYIYVINYWNTVKVLNIIESLLQYPATQYCNMNATVHVQ